MVLSSGGDKPYTDIPYLANHLLVVCGGLCHLVDPLAQ